MSCHLWLVQWTALTPGPCTPSVGRRDQLPTAMILRGLRSLPPVSLPLWLVRSYQGLSSGMTLALSPPSLPAGPLSLEPWMGKSFFSPHQESGIQRGHQPA